MYFHPTATSAYEEEYDALYMGVDPGRLGIATSISGFDYSINGLPLLNQNFSIPVKVTTGTTGPYQISAGEIGNLPSGACIVLHDNYTGANQDLRSGPYNCTVSDTEVVARFVLNLSIDPSLQVVSSVNNPSCFSSGNGSIVVSATGTSGPWNYYWKDANNNLIKTSLNKSTADTLVNLNGGNYNVDINTTGSCDNGTQSFTLQGSTGSNAAFIPSATSVILVNDSAAFSFTNTSTGADNYWWDFGDGNGSADTNTANSYASPGDFTVTLISYNAACGDSTITTQVVSVLDTTGSGVGIVTYAEKKNTMFIHRDAGGYFVQFDYQEKTNAVISVQNMLGEKVTADLLEKNISGEKVYIPLGNTENKLLILSVVTEAGQKAFCKILNQ
jgi:PKD repeat protein